MLAGGAELGSLFGFDDETAVAALPPDLAVALEEVASGTEIGNSLEFDFVVPPPHS